jgi:hypothetical protein
MGGLPTKKERGEQDVIKILMTVYGLTAEQAAARAPAAQFAVTSVIAALFVWLDSMGMFDDVGRWMGRKLREVLDAVSED